MTGYGVTPATAVRRSESPLVMCLGFDIAGQRGETLLRTHEGSFPWRPGPPEPRNPRAGVRGLIRIVHTLFTVAVQFNRRLFLLTRVRNVPSFWLAIVPLFMINGAFNPEPKKG